MDNLTAKDKKVYEYIKKMITENGLSPSVRDIQSALGIKSTSSVHTYLKRLEEAGYIIKEEGKSRTVRIDGVPFERKNKVPILGQLNVSSPLNPELNFDGYIDFVSPAGHFPSDLLAARINDDTLSGEGILKGDFIVVDRKPHIEEGELCVFVLEEKLMISKRSACGQHMYPAEFSDGSQKAILLGKLIACIRHY